MNKSKIIIPLMLVAPALFACNKGDGVNGNYVVKLSEIDHTFEEGNEEDYEKETDEDVYPKISTIKETIVNKFTSYMEGDKTEDSTIRLSSGVGVPGITESKENITLHDVNYHKKDETTSSVSFSYAKAKDGYHFYDTSADSETGKYNAHNKIIYYDESRGSGENSVSSFVDDGFSVKGKTLTSNILGKITVDNQLKYQIKFVVTATK